MDLRPINLYMFGHFTLTAKAKALNLSLKGDKGVYGNWRNVGSIQK